MFLRRCERRKNGKRHTYWALVESYRTAKGSRQRVVSYLGELAAGEGPGWAKLGRHLDGRQKPRRPQLSLFDPPPPEVPDDEPLLGSSDCGPSATCGWRGACGERWAWMSSSTA